MAWIKLAFVALCIVSILGLDQDIANPSDDSKPIDLTKNSIENPSSGDLEPSARDLTSFWWPRKEVSAAILGDYLNFTTSN